jgi:hypothetical protein
LHCMQHPLTLFRMSNYAACKHTPALWAGVFGVCRYLPIGPANLR